MLNLRELYRNCLLSTTFQSSNINRKIAAMKEQIKHILETLGEDVERHGMKDTPARAEKALHELTRGYHQTVDEIIGDAIFPSNSDAMVVVKDIEFYSLCEHHMLPFWGKCHVGYLPSGKLIGLSKIPRIVDMFARRFQVQEELTKQIANTIAEATGASGVGVVMQGQHMCMMMRGVSKQNAMMTTSYMQDKFKRSENTRQEFLQLIHSSL